MSSRLLNLKSVILYFEVRGYIYAQFCTAVYIWWIRCAKNVHIVLQHQEICILGKKITTARHFNLAQLTWPDDTFWVILLY